MPKRYAFFGLVSRRIWNDSTPGIAARAPAAARKSASPGEPNGCPGVKTTVCRMRPAVSSVMWLLLHVDAARRGLERRSESAGTNCERFAEDRDRLLGR